MAPPLCGAQKWHVITRCQCYTSIYSFPKIIFCILGLYFTVVKMYYGPWCSGVALLSLPLETCSVWWQDEFNQASENPRRECHAFGEGAAAWALLDLPAGQWSQAYLKVHQVSVSEDSRVAVTELNFREVGLKLPFSTGKNNKNLIGHCEFTS